MLNCSRSPLVLRSMALAACSMVTVTALGGCNAPGFSKPTSEPTVIDKTTIVEVNGQDELSCGEFFGSEKNDFQSPVSWQILTAAGDSNLSNDLSYAQLQSDTITDTFEGTSEEISTAADDLAKWFTSGDYNKDKLREAYSELAKSCSDVSVAAKWSVDPHSDAGLTDPGTKPAKLVCQEVAGTPQTLLLDDNNVLTSIMFRYDSKGYSVNSAQKEALASYFTAQQNAVDNDEVREALKNLGKPFTEDSYVSSYSAVDNLNEACGHAGISEFAEDDPEHSD